MKRDKMVDLAVKEALNNNYHRFRLAAVLCSRSGSVVVGYNKSKSHPLQYRFTGDTNKIYLHAEIDALVRASQMGINIHYSRIFIARVLKDGSRALAKPCKYCWKALLHFGVAEIGWTEDEDNVVFMSSIDHG